MLALSVTPSLPKWKPWKNSALTQWRPCRILFAGSAPIPSR
jgi:hypothetical protein